MIIINRLQNKKIEILLSFLIIVSLNKSICINNDDD